MTDAVRHTRRNLIQVVRDLQGQQSQTRFSARLGIEQSELSRFLRGQRGATGRIIASLLREFPERRDEIVDAITAESKSAAAVA